MASGWNNDLSGFLSVVERDMTEMVKTITLDAFGMLIRLSPTDTGAYRGNHRLSIGEPDTRQDAGDTGLENEDHAKSTIASLNVPFTTVYISNSLPYAEALENGSSQQAPQGVYETAFNSLIEKHSQ